MITVLPVIIGEIAITGTNCHNHNLHTNMNRDQLNYRQLMMRRKNIHCEGEMENKVRVREATLGLPHTNKFHSHTTGRYRQQQ